jgi:acetyltransferase
VDVEELVGVGKVGRLLGGYRGAPAADRGAVAALVLRVAQLVADFPEIAELDLNPVIAGPDGCVAVDARVRTAPVDRPRALKSW